MRAAIDQLDAMDVRRCGDQSGRCGLSGFRRQPVSSGVAGGESARLLWATLGDNPRLLFRRPTPPPRHPGDRLEAPDSVSLRRQLRKAGRRDPYRYFNISTTHLD
jgi:hypothetical protein